MSGLKRLTLSLPLFGILAMLAASTALAQPRPQAPVGSETTGQAQVPAPSGSRGENFSANKSPAQLFASDCTGAGCHKGPGGLAKGSSALSLSGFLREHYTNSRESAAALAAYLQGAGSGPADARPARGEPATPRPPRAAARTPGEDAAKPEEGQGPLTPARPRRQPTPGAPAPGTATPGAPAATPAGEQPADIAKPEPAKPTPAAAARNQQRGRPQHTTATPAQPEAAPPPPPPAPPPPVVHDIFD